MCFSAGASFAASGVIAFAAGATMAHVKNKRQLLLAAIPLVFSLQQFLEGILWMTPRGDPLTTFAMYAFLFFAMAFWPAWIPFATLMNEPDARRKKIMYFFCLLGLGVAVYQIGALITKPISYEIWNNHIRYIVGAPLQISGLPIYVAAVTGALFTSSHRGLLLLGAAMLISLFISLAFFYAAYGSVWCFFSAVLSLMVYWHVRNKE